MILLLYTRWQAKTAKLPLILRSPKEVSQRHFKIKVALTLSTNAMLGAREMGYLGVNPIDPKRRIRLFKVGVDGRMMWGDLPNNEIPPGKTILSRVSVFPNGTAVIGGAAFYMLVDPSGRGVAEIHRGNRYGTFSIGIDGNDAVSYGTDEFAPQDVRVPTGFNFEPIIHEQYHKIVAFKTKGLGGKIYDMSGRSPRELPDDWEYQDFNDRTFFIDALFTLTYPPANLYPRYNMYIELSAINISKTQFGL